MALVLLTGSSSSAQERDGSPDARGRYYFDLGIEAYQEGEFDAAVEHFQRAFTASGRASLHFNIGQSAQRAGDDELAIRSFERFLDQVPDSERRGEAERNLLVLRGEAEAEPRQDDPPMATYLPPELRAPSPAETAHMADVPEVEPSDDSSVLESPYLWIGVGALVVGGVILAILLSSGGEVGTHPDGTWGAIEALGADQ